MSDADAVPGSRPLCFVLMPFGSKKDPGGGPDIDFDPVYEKGIRPAIEDADLESIRADEERVGGIIHGAMFERLLLCDFAVADLTTANANVFYELGVRHAARPSTTLTIFAEQQQIPFDVNYLRSLPYRLAPGNQFTSDAAASLRKALAARLSDLRERSLRSPVPDSPIFQLLKDYKAPDIARLKTDTFREQVDYSARIKGELANARGDSDPDAIARVEESLGDLDGAEAGVLVDLFLSYRATSQWDRMVALHERLPAALARTVLVREQLAFALNRKGDSDGALRILEQVALDQGPSSETNGLIGRVYKDRWAAARSEGSSFLATGNLDRAIEAYVQGFEADWRDAYPGINAVTLLDVKGDETSKARQAELLPVVRFAVMQRLRASKPDYWDHATLLELAVLGNDPESASKALGDALASVRESWEPETTANNLKLIREARAARDEVEPWLEDFAQEFSRTLELQEGEMAVASVDEGLEVRMDPSHLRQVLWNLCDNAVKYASETGGILVELHAGRMQRTGQPFLEVLDQGHGVDPTTVDKIFEPFYTDRSGGTGLGLYISRELCELNRATLVYQDREQGGSIFRVVFADPDRWESLDS